MHVWGGQGQGDVVQARILPNQPQQVLIERIEGDGGRLPLEAAKNCAGIAALETLKALGYPPFGVSLSLIKVYSILQAQLPMISCPEVPVLESSGFSDYHALLYTAAGSPRPVKLQRWTRTGMAAGSKDIMWHPSCASSVQLLQQLPDHSVPGSQSQPVLKISGS